MKNNCSPHLLSTEPQIRRYSEDRSTANPVNQTPLEVADVFQSLAHPFHTSLLQQNYPNIRSQGVCSDLFFDHTQLMSTALLVTT